MVDPNTIGTFATHAWNQINPAPAAKLAWAGASLIANLGQGKIMDAAESAQPFVEMAKGLAGAHKSVFDQAKAAYDKGDYGDAGIKAIEFITPLIGPVASNVENEVRGGKYAAALGDGVGLATALFGTKIIGRLASSEGVTLGLPANSNPAEVAAVKFGEQVGIPADAGTATGSQFVKNVQKKVGSTWGGSAPAENFKAATAEKLADVGQQLVERADPVPATAETAGTAVRGAVKKVVGDLNDSANEAYGRLRKIEADPQFAQRVHTAPRGSGAEKRIMGKLAAGTESGQAPSVAELAVMRQLEADLDANAFKRGKLIEQYDDGGVTDSKYNRQTPNGKAYQEIGQASGSMMSGADMLAGIRKTLDTGEWNTASQGALAVAKKRLLNSGELGGPRLPEGAPLLGSEATVNLPVDLTATKKALQLVYDRLHRDNAVVPLMGGKAEALRALDRLMTGPDVESLSVVDSALGDLKTMARADIPELRTQGQGVAAAAVKELDRVVRQTAQRAGPDAIAALEEGRGATIAKYQVGDVLKQLKTEPVKVVRQLVERGDANVGFLRKVQESAPMEIPKVGRAVLEDLHNQATADGGFQHTDKLLSSWRKIGPETKKVLFTPEHVQDLDNFFLLAKKLGENPNPSGTAQVLNAKLNVVEALAALPSYAVSKVLYSPRAVKALSRGMSLSMRTTALPPAIRAGAMADIIKSARDVGVNLQALPAAAQAPEGQQGKAAPTSEPARSFSSTQVALPDDIGKKLAAVGQSIPDADLADQGRETDAHVTVKYGLHTNNVDEVRKLLVDQPPITVKLGTTSVFPNGPSNYGDVLKADVDSPDLHALNAKIAGALEHTDTHPEYVPHATIAYLKPGLGKKYAGNDALNGTTATIDRLTFSAADGKVVDIPLTGKAAPDDRPERAAVNEAARTYRALKPMEQTPGRITALAREAVKSVKPEKQAAALAEAIRRIRGGAEREYSRGDDGKFTAADAP